MFPTTVVSQMPVGIPVGQSHLGNVEIFPFHHDPNMYLSVCVRVIEVAHYYAFFIRYLLYFIPYLQITLSALNREMIICALY